MNLRKLLLESIRRVKEARDRNDQIYLVLKKGYEFRGDSDFVTDIPELGRVLHFHCTASKRPGEDWVACDNGSGVAEEDIAKLERRPRDN